MILSSSILYASFGLLYAVAFAHWFYLRVFSRRGIPATIAWAGVDEHARSPWLARARATLRSFAGTRGLVEEAYIKYTKKNLPYVLPNIFTGPELILPESQMHWCLRQSEDILCQNEVNRDFLQADQTMLHPKVVHDSVHGDVIRNELTKKLEDFIEPVRDEIDYAFRAVWGDDTENWKEVIVYDTMSEIISRISNRVLVGSPLCRDEDYLYNSSRFARWVVLESAFVSLLPQYLKSIFGPLITWPDFQLYKGMLRHIRPVWMRRTSAPEVDEKIKADYVQWSLDHANDARDPEERSLDMISKRLAALSFALIQSSVITASNLLFDLAASPRTESYMDTIRKDIDHQLEVENGRWTKHSLRRMMTLDSTIRESMRLWGFVSRGVLKTVVAKDGVTLPSGDHVPCRTKVGNHAYPIHHDEAIYTEAMKFHAFRFCIPSDSSEVPVALRQNMTHKVTPGAYQGIPLVRSSSIFMAFSHGNHACPGRYFAAQQLKLVLAHIAQNYEIQTLERRPDNNWFVGSSGPPLGDKIAIRRRKGTA